MGTSAAHPPDSGLRRLLVYLASLKLTAFLLLLLTAGVTAAYVGAADPTWVVAVPLALIAVNLGAALLVHPSFHRQPALLGFHLALMAGIVLIAVGRMTHFVGHVEMTQGLDFDASQVVTDSAGPWHPSRLGRVHFINEGYRIAYLPGVRREATRSSVSWRDEDGAWRRAEIGDLEPLVIQGYRFYTTTSNFGFAPTFGWRTPGGETQVGSIHLPAYPRLEFDQALTWTPPGTSLSLRTKLRVNETILDPEKVSELRPPTNYTLLVGEGEGRRELKAGESMRLPEGELTYLGLRTWMGYTIYYDPTLPWLLAAGVVGVLSLALFLRAKFAARPWNPVE